MKCMSIGSTLPSLLPASPLRDVVFLESSVKEDGPSSSTFLPVFPVTDGPVTGGPPSVLLFSAEDLLLSVFPETGGSLSVFSGTVGSLSNFSGTG